MRTHQQIADYQQQGELDLRHTRIFDAAEAQV